MGKSAHVILITSVVIVCLFSVLGISEGYIGSKSHILIIEGGVYCDPCHSALQSNLSEPLAGIPYYVLLFLPPFCISFRSIDCHFKKFNFKHIHLPISEFKM